MQELKEIIIYTVKSVLTHEELMTSPAKEKAYRNCWEQNFSIRNIKAVKRFFQATIKVHQTED